MLARKPQQEKRAAPVASRPSVQQRKRNAAEGTSLPAIRPAGPHARAPESPISSSPQRWASKEALKETASSAPGCATAASSFSCTAGSAGRVSKLEAEVARMERQGAALIRSPGSEVEGVALLEKSLWARTRFPSLQGSSCDAVWQRGEAFVMTCNQLATRAMQTLADRYVWVANQLMAAAERALCNTAMDPFAGFHPLRQHLLSMTLCNHAVLQRMNGEPVDTIVMTLEKAMAVEHPHPSTITMLNLATVYVQARQFDNAAEMASRCLALANHFLTLPASAKASDPAAFQELVEEAAVHAVLIHHLIATVAHWAGNLEQLELQHARLALACATNYLGSRHALTTRCINRLTALESRTTIEDPDEARDGSTPPLVSLQLALLPGRSRPSQLLPFVLAFALPTEATAPPPRTAAASSALPPIGEQNLGGDNLPRPTPKEAAGGSGGARAGVSAAAARSSARRSLTQKEVSGGGLGRRSDQPQHAATPSQRSRIARDLPAIEADPTPQRATSARKPPRNQPGKAGATSGEPAFPRPPAPPQRKPSQRSAFVRAFERDADESTPAAVATAASASEPQEPASTPLTRAPAPPAPPRKYTSVLPKRDFQLYQQLQEQVRGYVESAGRQRSFARRVQSLTTPYLRRGVDDDAAAAAAHMLGRSDGGSRGDAAVGSGDWRSTSQMLAALDAELHAHSEVCPDRTDAEERRWNAAVQTIQRWLRGCRGRAVARRCGERVAAHLRQLLAQETIRSWWLCVVAVRSARSVAASRRAEKAIHSAAAITQAFLRALLSYACCAGYAVRVQEAERCRWVEERRRLLAATLIQASIRGHHARSTLTRRRTAAVRVQRCWRWRRAFDICRLLVFHRRISARAKASRAEAAATRIQRWARLRTAAQCARGELHRRAEALALYMSHTLQRDMQHWLLVRDIDEGACLEQLQRVGRAVICRVSLQRYRASTSRRDAAARMLQRWFSFLTAEGVRSRRREQWQRKRLLQRRKEEVLEGALTIQALARRFLARVSFLRLLAERQRRHDAARVLQRLARRASYHQRVAHLVRERRGRAERYHRAQLRAYAAVKIQSVFRMHRDRVEVGRFKHFMLVGRHILAARIQRVARRFLARRRREVLLREFAEERDATLLMELRVVAARRIQATFRMYVEKQRRRGQVVAPIEARRAAAKRIQKVWRSYAATQRVRQLLLARQHTEQTLINEEHRHVYALQIQALVRRVVLNNSRVACARQRAEELAALRIQRVARRYLGRLHVARLFIIREESAEREFAHEELHFAAMRIQTTLRAHLARKELLRCSGAVTRIANWFRGISARRHVAALRASRHGLIEEQDAQLREAAARTLQAAWRSAAPTRTPP